MSGYTAKDVDRIEAIIDGPESSRDKALRVVDWLNTRSELMTPAEVAARFGVDAKTVARWAKSAKIESLRTPGGHRRYRKTDVDDMASFGFENSTD